MKRVTLLLTCLISACGVQDVAIMEPREVRVTAPPLHQPNIFPENTSVDLTQSMIDSY
jgi:hypothetical protein